MFEANETCSFKEQVFFVILECGGLAVMKLSARNIALILFAGIVFCFSAAATRAQNSISGIIFDAGRQPVPKIDVELLDEFERLLKSFKTTSS